jgi:YihY family inner membrane protein
MTGIERVVRRVDAFQQAHQPFSFLFAVNKKAGDDNAGPLIANLSYVGFLSVFPLLLLAVTVLQILAGSYPGIHATLDRSVVAQMPIIGDQLVAHVAPLHRTNVVGLVVGLLGLLWGSTGLSGAGMFTMAQLWNVPGVDRPNFLKRLGRSGLFLVMMAVDLAVTGLLAGFGTYGRHDGWLVAASEILSGVVNVAAYFVAFRILTPHAVRTRRLLPGAAVGGVAWTALLALGGYLIGHDLRHDTAVYGFFAYVLGLVAWVYLAARIFVYAAEINVVIAYRLWPRSIVSPPLTEADRRSLSLQATANRRRTEQLVEVRWSGPPATPDLAGPGLEEPRAG